MATESADGLSSGGRKGSTGMKLVRSTPTVMPKRYSMIETLAAPTAPPDNELSIFKVAKEVLSSVKPGSDVTNINLPASVLDPVSTLEKAKKSMQRGELIQDICAPNQSDIERLLNVMRFNLSGLARERFGKKPYNPILGEIYRCCFVHRNGGGVTLLVAEQVSHHPPITALHLRNDTLGFTMNSHTAPEPRFWGNSLEVKLSGGIRIILERYDNEEYTITRPYIYMTGFIAGKQRLEFNGTSRIECKRTGLGAEIEYKAKGAMNYRTEMNGIQGRIFELKSNKTLHTLEGHWDKLVTLKNMQTREESTLFDYAAVVMEKSMVAIVPSDDEKNRTEVEDSFSTLVWRKCSSAILAGETLTANNEKRKVEDVQRRLRKERAAAKIEWQHHYFCKVGDFDAGYDLRPDLKNKDLTHIDISESQMKALKSGQLVEEMLEKLAEAEVGNVEDGGRKGLFRRRLLSRR